MSRFIKRWNHFRSKKNGTKSTGGKSLELNTLLRTREFKSNGAMVFAFTPGVPMCFFWYYVCLSFFGPKAVGAKSATNYFSNIYTQKKINNMLETFLPLSSYNLSSSANLEPEWSGNSLDTDNEWRVLRSPGTGKAPGVRGEHRQPQPLCVFVCCLTHVVARIYFQAEIIGNWFSAARPHGERRENGKQQKNTRTHAISLQNLGVKEWNRCALKTILGNKKPTKKNFSIIS